MSKKKKIQLKFDGTSDDDLTGWLIAQSKYFDDASRIKYGQSLQRTGKEIEEFGEAIQKRINESNVTLKERTNKKTL